jgi:hypothetical protein
MKGSNNTPRPLRSRSISGLDSAAGFLVWSGSYRDSEIWRVEDATKLKGWLLRVAEQCECVIWDVSRE